MTMNNNKTPSEIIADINQKDVYSILCSFLYEMKSIPEYSLISELCYLLDVDSFMKLIRYFKGQTITIPTEEEFCEATKVLMLYNYSEVEKRPWKDALALAGFSSSSGKLAHNKLDKLKDTIKKYNFGNRNY